MRIFISVLILLVANRIQAQEKYLFVGFNDKQNTALSYVSAKDFLSEKTISKRMRYAIPVTIDDLPVNPRYVHAVSSICKKRPHYVLRWENGMVISTEEENISSIKSLPFVDEVRIIGRPKNAYLKLKNEKNLPPQPFRADYGTAWPQIGMLGVNHLHLMGYSGHGVSLAVFDAGFTGVDTVPFFSQLWTENRIKGQYDFVDGEHPVTHGSTHGTLVLSVMAAQRSGQLIGTAPYADYYLYRTEEPSSERLIEEYNWARAAEHADSIGIDIINSSLGYTTFDDSTENHTYKDMDGNTTPVTRAANKAASKGILVVASAGNSGVNPWYYISAPADGRDVLAVGAVNSALETAPFSSRGPNAAGQTKPNVCAQGWRTVVANLSDTIQFSNGTSFSGPLIAGACASLWQAFPDFDNFAIKEVVEKSCHQYPQSDHECGYGIPDFARAFEMLETRRQREFPISPEQLSHFALYPNPTEGKFTVSFFSAHAYPIALRITNSTGIEHFSWKSESKPGNNYIRLLLPQLAAGQYILSLDKGFEINHRVLIVD